MRNSLAASSERLEIRLDPRAGISGRVISDVDDRPVSGAVVRWSGSAVPDARVTIRPFKSRMTGGFQLDYRTDLHGRTVAKPIPEGRLRVSADHESHLRMRRVYSVDPGERQLRIEMEPGHSISGRLTWPDGSPAAEMFVGARATYPGKKYNVEENARTDRNGEFTIERLPAGAIELTAVCEREGRSYRVKAKADAGESGVSLVLAKYVDPAGKRKLRIRILDSAGQPVSRAWGIGSTG